MTERVVLTIGTKKGVFVAEASKPRRRFELRGPFGPGVPVYATLLDTRGTPTIYASSCNPFFGMKVLKSKNLGKSFSETKAAPAFPKDDGRALANIWSLEPGNGEERTVVRRRAGLALPQPRRRRQLGDGAGHQQPRPRPQVVAGQRRAVHAHHHSRRPAHAPGHLHRRPLSERGRRRDFPGVESGHRSGLRPRSVSGVRPVRPQDRAARRRAGAALYAEPRRLGRLDRPRRPAARHRRAAQRRPRQVVALDRQGAAVRFRVPARRPSPRRRHHLRGAAGDLDAGVSGRSAGGVAQRERRRVVAQAGAVGFRRRRATSPCSAMRWTSTG